MKGSYGVFNGSVRVEQSLHGRSGRGRITPPPLDHMARFGNSVSKMTDSSTAGMPKTSMSSTLSGLVLVVGVLVAVAPPEMN